LGGSIQALKKRAETSVAASKEFCLEVNAEKTKYTSIVMSGEKHAGQNHGIKIGNKSFESVEHFKYL
jgi:hypothetical protein